jgi:glycerol kinase
MQFHADLLGLPVEVAVERETTALGAAALAAGRDVQVAVGAVYEPRIGRDEAADLRRGWALALRRAQSERET